MKKAKKLAAFLLTAAVATAGVSALAACGGGNENESETYTIHFTSGDVGGNLEMMGYLAAAESDETNTLVLNSDKTYVYTKLVESHKDFSSMMPSASSEVTAVASVAAQSDDNVLFSWTSAGDGMCTLDFNKDGTYKFVFTSYNMTETGTWSWSGWTMTLTQSNDNVITATMDDATHALNVHYVGATSSQLTHDFTLGADVWGAAFGGEGSYTPVNNNLLFAWTSAGDGMCTLDFNKDGTYKFVFTSYNMTETGTWKWENWTMTLTQSNDNVITATMDDTTHALNVHYVAVQGGGQLYHDFTLGADVWGAAFGGEGSYTPVEGGGNEGGGNEGGGNEGGGSSAEIGDPAVKIEYIFKGEYTIDGNTVTLKPATSCTWSEHWGIFVTVGFINCGGTEKDNVKRNSEYDADGGVDPLTYFGGEYFKSTGNTETKVEIDKANKTFKYVTESSFD